ncbi:S8 family peptidase [Streptomyces sp. NBC_00335]|uniref:S8 family peptidase n=1 Tax=unclassified Streptomyces TaxID=2593676 RepID=UPI00225AC06E|nr:MULTISPECIES: S8 family peptidase [unclassified Streptomyces]MCX5402835.1 S8 family peptidase [Streptomyces sp. NBC_00086]
MGTAAAGAQPALAANSTAQGTHQDSDQGTKAAAKAGAKPSTEATVTLITGDRVVVGGDGAVVRITQGAGREKTTFSVRRESGHTYVIPVDALRLVDDGVLDQRLFDVAQLARDGYDDAHRGALPLIVAYRKDGATVGAFATGDPFARIARERRPLPSVDGEAFDVSKSEASALWSAVTAGTDARAQGATPTTPIARVWLDGKVRTSLDTSVPQIGAPVMWKAGYTGTGVKVAVLDTGVDQAHPDLKGIEIAEKNFSDAPDSLDRNGHGTHVASTVAGTGAQSGGRYKGVAPGARILDGKVINDDGWGVDSGIISGMQWAVDQGAKVVNMSLGGQDFPGVDPKEAAVARLSPKALFVISAGNSGDLPGTIASPGSSPAALTVGAVDKQNLIADFSSRGPTADGVSKPDITAPGVDITAALSTHAWNPDGKSYTALSGTSMAAPHVTGAAALALQQHPTWGGAQIKALLTGSARPDPALNASEQGSGRVDLARAATAVVVSTPDSVDFGTQLWPHGDDKPVGKLLTYRNYGTTPVTLKLSATTTGPGGGPAPAGMFTLKDAQLTVPARGTATTTVTVDTRKGTADGTYGGSVLAAGGGQSVRTGLVVVREAEAYDVVLRHTDVDGAAPTGYSSMFTKIDREMPGRIKFPFSASGTVVKRIPRGDYQLESVVFGPDGRMAVFVQPVVKVTAKTTIALDARQAKPLAVTAPDPAARLVGGTIGYSDPNARVGSSWNFDGQTQVRTAALGAASAGLQAQFNGLWKNPGAAGKNVDYRLAFNRTGSWFTGFTKTVTRAEVAELKLGFAASVTGAKGLIWMNPYDVTGTSAFGMRDPIEQDLPLSGIQYVSAVGVRWTWNAYQLDAQGDTRMGYDVGLTSYRPGGSSAVKFNFGVVGPSMEDEGQEAPGGRRTGDNIYADLRLFNDGSGHVGGSVVTRGFTRLESGGKVIAEGSDGGQVNADVPAGSAVYRLSAEASRSPLDTTTSTKVAAAWTFTSARPTGDESVRLPLSTVRFAPTLSLRGTARVGADLKVPLHLGGPAAGAGQVAALTVRVSFDEGKTWKLLTVTTDAGGARSVNVQHPATAKSVSFQVDLKDKAGNTVRETITNAYRLVP